MNKLTERPQPLTRKTLRRHYTLSAALAAACVAAVALLPHHDAHPATVRVSTASAETSVPSVEPTTTTTISTPVTTLQAAAPVAQEPLPAPLPTTTTTTTAAAKPGHYDCTGDDNASAVCSRSNDQPELPVAAGSDQPGQTLGSTDAAYGAQLTNEVCEAKPWTC